MKKILVVEDYEDSREFMRILLERYGFSVIEAEDGLDAIEKAKKCNPDLILMDICLPVVDGLTATRFIRDYEKEKHTPIIAITSFGKDYYKKAIEAGCDNLIKKPIDFEEFHPTISQYLPA